jgi:hypothetical protein
MKQQINLYQERFHLKRVVLPAVEMYALVGIGLALLIMSSIGLHVVKMRIDKVEDQLSRQQQEILASNDQLKLKAEAHKVSLELQKAVADASKKLVARKRVLDWVKRSQSEDRVAFSTLLGGLGRHYTSGLWLSEFKVDQKVGSMRLQGNTLNPELVPMFLASLRKEEAFSGTEFKKIKMEELEVNGRILQFLLSTEQPESKKRRSSKKSEVKS